MKCVVSSFLPVLTVPNTPRWKRIAEQLPPREAEEWYKLSDIAPLLGIKPRALLEHARDLWPDWEGHFRLNYEQAVRLIKRVSWAGKKVPRDHSHGGKSFPTN
jgi:hypothetical protein